MSEALLRQAYAAFNARDLDAALALMRPDVDWPNAIASGRVRGHADVRAYWEQQFETIDPRVEPERFTERTDASRSTSTRSSALATASFSPTSASATSTPCVTA